MKQILVAIDGSEESHRAATYAAQIAKATHAPVQLIHVAPIAPDFDASPEWDEWRKGYDQYARQLLDTARTRPELSGVPVETKLAYGNAADELARAAKDDGVSLVVVGSRGRGMVARTLMGSVSNRLLHVCDKPLLVVR